MYPKKVCTSAVMDIPPSLMKGVRNVPGTCRAPAATNVHAVMVPSAVSPSTNPISWWHKKAVENVKMSPSPRSLCASAAETVAYVPIDSAQKTKNSAMLHHPVRVVAVNAKSFLEVEIQKMMRDHGSFKSNTLA
jgi:hypothetical protein